MRIKLLAPMAMDRNSYRIGDIIEHPDKYAAALIADGHAVPVDHEDKEIRKGPGREAAAVAAPETAAHKTPAARVAGKAKAVLVALALLLVLGAVAVAQVPKVYKDSSGDRLVVASGGSLENYQGAGAIAAHTDVTTAGLTLAEYGDTAVHKTVWTFDEVSLYITDATTAGAHGKIKLYEGPAGWIKLVGASSNLTMDCNSTGLTDTATYDIGVGTATVGTDNAALTTTETDILADAGGDLSDADGLNRATMADVNTSGFGTDFDGHTTAVDYFLNVAFAADDASANDTCTLNGTITIVWINLGDY